MLKNFTVNQYTLRKIAVVTLALGLLALIVALWPKNGVLQTPWSSGQQGKTAVTPAQLVQEDYKKAKRYYRKNGTLEGFKPLTGGKVWIYGGLVARKTEDGCYKYGTNPDGTYAQPAITPGACSKTGLFPMGTQILYSGPDQVITRTVNADGCIVTRAGAAGQTSEPC